jgi:hypothetical protein
MKSPWASPGDRVKGWTPHHNGPNLATKPPRGPWLIIVYDSELFSQGGPLTHRCTHAIHFSAFGLCFPLCRLGGVGGQSRFHRRQPGRRIWRRPMPGQGRQMWCPCRPFLLPITEFRGSNSLPAGRSGRNHRGSPQGRRKLHPRRMHRIRRHYLPALSQHLCRPWQAPPHRCRGNDVTPPRETGKASRQWPCQRTS